MSALGRILVWLGGNGPVLLIGALALGIAAEPLGIAGYKLLPVSAFLLTFGSFLTAGLAPFEANLSGRVIGISLLWVGVAMPIGATAILSSVSLEPAFRTGVILSLLAPPVGSAAAIAAMTRLQPRLALIVSITLTLMAPFTIPAFAIAFGLGLEFDIAQVSLRLFTIIGTAALVAWIVLRHRNRLLAVLPEQRAATGIAVVGLIIVGLAMSHGVGDLWHSDRSRFVDMMIAAVGINFGSCLLTALIFCPLGLTLSGTVGLVSGNRNVTLAWAAASASLPTLAEGYLATCVIPVLILPLIVKLGISLLQNIQCQIAATRAQRDSRLLNDLGSGLQVRPPHPAASPGPNNRSYER